MDGVFELSLRLAGPRAVRELVAMKFRGSDSLLGRHEVEISERGIVIHPRTEVQFANPEEQGREDRIRMAFGIPRLDESLRGGVLSGSTTMLLGAPGTGKTLLGLHFLLQGAREGQPGVYFGFYETPPRLLEKAAGVGMKDLKEYVDKGLIEIQWQPPLEHNMDSLAERLLERLHERNVKRLRLSPADRLRRAAHPRHERHRALGEVQGVQVGRVPPEALLPERAARAGARPGPQGPGSGGAGVAAPASPGRP